MQQVDAVKQAYDGVGGENYDRHYSGRKQWAEDFVVLRELYEALERTTAPCDRIIDLACGTGAVCHMLHELNVICYNYVGVDVSDEMLDTAVRKYPVGDKHGRRTFVRDDVCRRVREFAVLARNPDLLDKDSNTRFVVQNGATIVTFLYAANYFDSDSMVRMLQELMVSCWTNCTLIIAVPTARYARSREYVLWDYKAPVKTTWRTLDQLVADVSRSGWRVRKARGFSWLSKILPEFVPQTIHDLAQFIESHTIGRLFPDRCQFHVVVAEKGDFADLRGR